MEYVVISEEFPIPPKCLQVDGNLEVGTVKPEHLACSGPLRFFPTNMKSGFTNNQSEYLEVALVTYRVTSQLHSWDSFLAEVSDPKKTEEMMTMIMINFNPCQPVLPKPVMDPDSTLIIHNHWLGLAFGPYDSFKHNPSSGNPKVWMRTDEDGTKEVKATFA